MDPELSNHSTPESDGVQRLEESSTKDSSNEIGREDCLLLLTHSLTDEEIDTLLGTWTKNIIVPRVVFDVYGPADRRSFDAKTLSLYIKNNLEHFYNAVIVPELYRLARRAATSQEHANYSVKVRHSFGQLGPCTYAPHETRPLRIHVDLLKLAIIVDDVEIGVDLDVARFVQCVIKGKGQYVTEKDMTETFDGTKPRRNRIVPKIPPHILELLEISEKRGTRLRDVAWLL